MPPACDSPCASCIYLSDSFLITRHQASPPTFPWCTPHRSLSSSGLQFHLLATLESRYHALCYRSGDEAHTSQHGRKGVTSVQFCSSGLLSPIDLVHMENHSQSPKWGRGVLTWSCVVPHTHFLSDSLRFGFVALNLTSKKL